MINVSIVEDDAKLRATLERYLMTQPGFQCVSVYPNAEAALATYLVDRPAASSEERPESGERYRELYVAEYGVRGLRTFKIERIRGVSVTPRTFDAPEEGALERELRRGWDIISDQEPVEVVLRFSPVIADRVLETTWHPLQRTERQGDGSLIWRTTVSGVIEIRLWILSWGDDAEVLEPPELRQQVRDILGRARAKYEPG